MKLLNLLVFPSKTPTIAVAEDKDYGGAHLYTFNNCTGFADGETGYNQGIQEIQFVQKNEDGSMTPGLQSEQLLYALIDRHQKLDARYPSEFNKRMIAGMQEAIDAMEDRVKDRIKRGVMGDLKK